MSTLSLFLLTFPFFLALAFDTQLLFFNHLVVRCIAKVFLSPSLIRPIPGLLT